MSPCSSRTARPSLRSMAGKRIILLLRHSGRLAKQVDPESSDGFRVRELHSRPGMTTEISSRRPFQKIRDQLQPELLALLRVKLRADDVITADDGGQRPAVFRQHNQIS